MLSLSRDMLSAASKALPYLGLRRDRIAAYLLSQLAEPGGFADRGGTVDLYYSVFGIDGLLALEAPLPTPLGGYLASHGNGEHLDLIHLACLARGHSRVSAEVPPELHAALTSRLEASRTADGGYGSVGTEKTGTITGAYLAFGAYGDMETELPHAGQLLRSIGALKSADGGYANAPGLKAGAIPATAGTLIMQHALSHEVDAEAATWLWKQQDSSGGFPASPATPMPDLLSTATAVYAASRIGHPVDAMREGCVILAESLQQDDGGFAGHWLDAHPDCEYTFYALLVLGILMGDSGIDSSEFME